MLALLGGRSLLAETIARARAMPGAAEADVLLIAGESMAADAAQETAAGGAPGAALLLEPEPKNTAAAAAFAALHAQSLDPDAILALLPSDHHVAAPDKLHAALAHARALAAEGHIVTLGATPTCAHTGYGYIARGQPLGAGFKVLQFVEKPQAAEAERLHAGGAHDWNCGVFVFQAKIFLDELARYEPTVHAAAQAAFAAGRLEGRIRRPDGALWARAPSISIDYAIAERSERFAVIPVSMGWSDIGSWDSLWSASEKDDLGNVQTGDVVAIDARNNLVQANGKLVAILGLEDMIIVDTPEAIFAAPRARSEDVRLIVKALKDAGRGELL
jgi:mannose-1-phosphate guanylyltransferase/mannose-6-phosphate isomerase